MVELVKTVLHSMVWFFLPPRIGSRKDIATMTWKENRTKQKCLNGWYFRMVLLWIIVMIISTIWMVD